MKGGLPASRAESIIDAERAIMQLVDRVRAALAALAPAMRASAGVAPMPSTPEDYAADIDREETKWSRIVKQSGARAN